MKNKKFFIFLSLIFFLVTLVIIFEKTDYYLKIVQKEEKVPLYASGYYSNKILIQDPYKIFHNIKLHPTLFFSNAWKANDIKKINSTNFIVKINKNGFRVSSFQQEKKKKIIFLGGSTAFGWFASSNETTISSLLNKMTDYNFINVNAPSWKSYQEFLALSNIDNFDKSISFSLYNDLSGYCYNKIDKYPINTNIFFKTLEERFNLREKETNFLSNLIYQTKNLISVKFPKTYLSYAIKKKNNFHPINYLNLECLDDQDINLLAKTFIKNQILMNNIFQHDHFLVIQPIFQLPENKSSKILINEKIRKIINKIMSSEFCKSNCLDLSNLFKNIQKKELIYKNGKNPNNYIFIDNVHLTDRGNKLVALEIKKFLNRVNGY
ncbi:hypothetical protein OAT00_03710 [Pelagibacteraceae bacterium]|nr:hypothetical protein [Pelagibacteraceae bacterium]